MPISVKTPVYEGPLEVLLELIEKRKLLINDISLASVTDEYIARVNAMESLPVGETAEFISLAATLLLIKSRSLLQGLQLSEDESRDIKELQYRLAVYQLIKEASVRLGRSDLPLLYEGTPREQEPLFIPDPSVTLASLRSAAQQLMEGFPATLALPKVEVKKIMSLEEMIDKMAARIQGAIKMSFREFTGASKSDFPSKSDLLARHQTMEHHIESLLFALGRPLSRAELQKMLGATEAEINSALHILAEKKGGVVLVDDGAEVELRVAPECAALIEKIRKEEYSREIGKAGMEALSAVLYRGPLSRAGIDFIRGVNSSQTLRTLTLRGLLRRIEPSEERTLPAGRRGSFLYEPTTELLAELGVSRLQDLPDYAEVRDKLQQLEEAYRQKQEEQP